MRYLILIFLFTYNLIKAQPNEGAIKTSTGFLLYGIDGANSYTLELNGKVDLSDFPFVTLNDTLFQFYTRSKVDFGSDNKSVLNTYMNYEFDYFQNQFAEKLDTVTKLFTMNGLNANFWKVIHPIIKDDKVKKIVKATYFIDFIHSDYLFRFCYSSLTGNDIEARQLLQRLSNNLRFYNKGLDTKKLVGNVKEGINYYIE